MQEGRITICRMLEKSDGQKHQDIEGKLHHSTYQDGQRRGQKNWEKKGVEAFRQERRTV